MESLILASLANEPKDAEAEALVTRFLAGIAGDSPVAFLKSGYKVPPSVLRDMWRTPRGKTWARKIAYEDLTYAEFVKVPVLLLAYEITHQAAVTGDLNADQDALLWKVAEDGFALLLNNKFGTTEGLQLAFSWKGYTNRLGWDGLAPSLEPSFRGPMA